LAAAIDDRTVLLDVREWEEAENAPVPPTLAATARRLLVVPLGELRRRLEELDRSERIVAICRRGPRSYQAALILRDAGFGDVAVAAAGLQALE